MKTYILWGRHQNNEVNALGESPLWHHKEQMLYWLDIVQSTIHQLEPESGDYYCWSLPNNHRIGSIVPRAQGGLIATIDNKIIALNTRKHQSPIDIQEVIAEINPWHKACGMNDGKCDAKGRFWIGVADWKTEQPQGGLYRLDPDGTLQQMEDNITISNGLGWSPDHHIFYYTDGLRYTTYQYDFNLPDGTIHNRRNFVTLQPSPIEPDGLTIDSSGYLWHAHWNAGEIVRYKPNGTKDSVLKIPTTRPTSCIFGGKGLNHLYVTSCSRTENEPTPLPYPAGAVFDIDVDIIGIPENEFGG